MSNPIVHFEIAGKDGDKTVAFYKDLFGWETEHSPASDYHFGRHWHRPQRTPLGPPRYLYRLRLL